MRSRFAVVVFCLCLLANCPFSQARQVIYITGGTLSDKDGEASTQVYCAELPELPPTKGDYVLATEGIQITANGAILSVDKATLADHIRLDRFNSITGQGILSIRDKAAFEGKLNLRGKQYSITVGPAAGITTSEIEEQSRRTAFERIRDDVAVIAPSLERMHRAIAAVEEAAKGGEVLTDSLKDLLKDAFQLYLWSKLDSPVVTESYQLVNWDRHRKTIRAQASAVPQYLRTLAGEHADMQPELSAALRDVADILETQPWHERVTAIGDAVLLKGGLPDASRGEFLSATAVRMSPFETADQYFEALKGQSAKRFASLGKAAEKIVLDGSRDNSQQFVSLAKPTRGVIPFLAYSASRTTTTTGKLFNGLAAASAAAAQYVAMAQKEFEAALRRDTCKSLRVVIDLPIAGDEAAKGREKMSELNASHLGRLSAKYKEKNVAFLHLRGSMPRSIADHVLDEIKGHNRDEFLVVIAHNDFSSRNNRATHTLEFADGSKLTQDDLLLAGISERSHGFALFTCPRGIKLGVQNAESFVDHLVAVAAKGSISPADAASYILTKGVGTTPEGVGALMAGGSGGPPLPPGPSDGGANGGGASTPGGGGGGSEYAGFVLSTWKGDSFVMNFVAVVEDDDDDDDEKLEDAGNGTSPRKD